MELALLATVQGFYQRLLSDQLGGELPTPTQLALDAIIRNDDLCSTLNGMRVWIQVLNMAISPAMLRLGMQPELDPEVAEALLRYLARYRDANCDKADLVATFLFRCSHATAQWERPGVGFDDANPLSPFEVALLEILSESDVPALSDADLQVLGEFKPLLELADRFRDFTALIDSGIIPRVRELKAALGESIYHPRVLATLAPYNAAFGQRFSALFATATREIKDFGARLEEVGGSILSTVDGVEITVQHVAALNPEALIKLDYSVALEKFRRVSRLKRELERRPAIRPGIPEHKAFSHARGS
ncbi:MAG: hypothetical protein WB566_15020 [Terriglobales bacterium]